MVRMEIESGPWLLLFFLNKWVCGCPLCAEKKQQVQTVPKYKIREMQSTDDTKYDINHMHKLCILTIKQMLYLGNCHII